MNKLYQIFGLTLLSFASLNASGWTKQTPKEPAKPVPVQQTSSGSVLDPYQMSDAEDDACIGISLGYTFGALLPTNRVIATPATTNRLETLVRTSDVTYPVNLMQGFTAGLSIEPGDDNRFSLKYNYFSGNSNVGGKTEDMNGSILVSTWPVANLVTGETGTVYTAYGQYDVHYNQEFSLTHFRELFYSKRARTGMSVAYGFGGLFRKLSLITAYSVNNNTAQDLYVYKQNEHRQTGFLTVTLKAASKLSPYASFYAGLTGNGHIGNFKVASSEKYIAENMPITSGLNQSSSRLRFFFETQTFAGLNLEFQDNEGICFGLDLQGMIGIEPDATTLGIPQTSSTASALMALTRSFGTLSLYTKF